MLSLRGIVLATGLLGLAGGCNWAPFDDLAKKAPVQAIDVAGTTLLALQQGQGGSHATLLAATPGSSLVVDVISFQGDGSSSKNRFPGGRLQDNTTYSPVVMVEIPGHEDAAWVVAGTPLVTQPNTSGIALLLKDVAGEKPDEEALPVDPADSHFGRGMVISRTSKDLIVSSEFLGPTAFLGADLTPSKKVVYKADPGDTCVAAADPTFASSSTNGASAQQRAMVELQARTAAVPAIVAAGDPVGAGTGGVSFFTLDTGLHCLGRLTSTEARFGQTLVTGDFNGDGTLDLAVGAPPKTVYVFFGPFTAAAGVVSAQGKATLSSASTNTFGASLLAFKPDGEARVHLAVGDYTATAGSTANAGSVTVYGFATGLPETGTVSDTLIDPSPEGGGAFGQAMTLLPFCRSPNSEAPLGCEPAARANLVTVGATNQLFVFFNKGEGLGSTGDARDPG